MTEVTTEQELFCAGCGDRVTTLDEQSRGPCCHNLPSPWRRGRNGRYNTPGRPNRDVDPDAEDERPRCECNSTEWDIVLTAHVDTENNEPDDPMIRFREPEVLAVKPKTVKEPPAVDSPEAPAAEVYLTRAIEWEERALTAERDRDDTYARLKAIVSAASQLDPTPAQEAEQRISELETTVNELTHENVRLKNGLRARGSKPLERRTVTPTVISSPPGPPPTQKPRMRNYKRMGDAKLLECFRELEKGRGNAYVHAQIQEREGKFTIAEHKEAVRYALKERPHLHP